MTQTPERRMYLMWRSAKRSRDSGEAHSPMMRVAIRFRVPISHVREAIEAQRQEPK